MTSTTRNLSSLLVFAAALVVIVIGAVTSHSGAPLRLAVPADRVRVTQTPQLAASPTKAKPAPDRRLRESGPPGEGSVFSANAPAGAPQPQVTGRLPVKVVPARQRAGVKRVVARASVDARGPLPPLLPFGGPQLAAGTSAGSPPNVLRLSGVVGDERKVAVLRQGESRYVVREGDAISGGYRVVRISAKSVTLQRGGRKRTLGLGQ
jgi:hypothetical protein